MTMNDCVPCAKCGGMHLVRKDNGIGQPYIRCTGCINFCLPSPTFDMAVAEWNRMNGQILRDRMKGSKTMTGEKTLVYLPVEQLDPHPNNPRKDLGDLTELTESIKANGVLQNLTVVPKDESWQELAKEYGEHPTEELRNRLNDARNSGQYTVIIGHRRLAAAKLAGLSTVPCVIMQMDELEQIRTMAIENMHRSDLTPIEQADSFQMMLDLGDTVQTISANTGFSETTVRNRLKLREYDREKLTAASARGGTLQDYMELQKVKDPERRNKVLDAIGTANFKNELESNLEAEHRAEMNEYYIGEISKWAKKFPKKESTWNGNWESVKTYYARESKKEVEVPKDAETAEYYYSAESYGVSVYKRKVKEKAKREKKSPEQLAYEHWFKEITEKLEDTAKRHKKLRLDFVHNLSEGSLIKKKPMAEIVTACSLLLSGYIKAETDKYWLGDFVKTFYGFEKGAYECKTGGEDGAALLEEYAATLRKEPTKLLLVCTIGSFEGHSAYIPFWAKNYQSRLDSYKDNEPRYIEALKAEYDLLEKLGYEVSDEEMKTMNGEFLKELLATAPEMPEGGTS